MKPDRPFEPNPISLVSHKMRTPLTVIMSTVNNLLDGAHGPLNNEQQKWVRKLESHTTALESILNEILSFLKDPDWEPGKIQTIAKNEHKPVSGSFSGIQQALAVDTAAGKSPLILIVDDEQDIRDLVCEAMAIKGFNCLTAANEQEALQAVTQKQPDLVLMDVLLGRQNGIEIARRIKSEAVSFTPVILITGQDDLRDKISGSPHDADDLLTKPFQIEELLTRVSSILRLKRMHDELEHYKSKVRKAA